MFLCHLTVAALQFKIQSSNFKKMVALVHEAIELFRVNVANDDNGENEPSLYDGLEPSELLNTG